MKYSKVISVLSCLTTFYSLNSCSDNDDGYTGTNYAYITSDKSSTLNCGENQEMDAKLTLSRKVDKATEIKLKITNQTTPDKQVIETTPKSLMVAAGSREAAFKVKILDDVSIINEQTIQISVQPQKELLEAKEVLTITVKPKINIAKLTTEQKKLLEGYKQKGMDITPFLGKQKVKTTVISNEEDKDYGFPDESVNYEGITVITLSELSTPQQPVLKMTQNPMGMTDFFYDVLKHETIFSDNWYGEYASEYSTKVMNLINWNKTSKETFSASLDSIKIKLPKSGVSAVDYIGKRPGPYDDPESRDIKDCVPFIFHYTAWDRLKKLIDEGNKDGIECDGYGQTSRPDFWINATSSITEDEYGGELFKETTGSINFKEGKMTFEFLTSHDQGYDYNQLKAEYSIK